MVTTKAVGKSAAALPLLRTPPGVRFLSIVATHSFVSKFKDEDLGDDGGNIVNFGDAHRSAVVPSFMEVSGLSLNFF